MTNLADTHARHAQFTEKHNTAKQEAEAAQSALKAAQNARVALLDSIAQGTAGKTAKELAAADDAIRTARHEAELQDGLQEAAKRAKDKVQVEVWQAQAADIKSRLRAACDEQIEAGKELDAAIKVATEAAERFNGLSRRISAITHEGHHHDQTVLSEGAGAITALGARQNTWPRTRIAGHPAQPPVFVALHQHNNGWPVKDVHSAEQIAAGTRGFFGTTLNA